MAFAAARRLAGLAAVLAAGRLVLQPPSLVELLFPRGEREFLSAGHTANHLVEKDHGGIFRCSERAVGYSPFRRKPGRCETKTPRTQGDGALWMSEIEGERRAMFVTIGDANAIETHTRNGDVLIARPPLQGR
jgi:hypothetical protein